MSEDLTDDELLSLCDKADAARALPRHALGVVFDDIRLGIAESDLKLACDARTIRRLIEEKRAALGKGDSE